MAARLAMLCSVDFWAGEMSLLVNGALARNPTRMMVTLFVPMKINPRCTLSRLVQVVSKPQLVMARLVAGSVVSKTMVWS